MSAVMLADDWCDEEAEVEAEDEGLDVCDCRLCTEVYEVKQ